MGQVLVRGLDDAEKHSTEAIGLLDAGFRRHIPVLLHTEFGQTIWKM